MTTPQAADPARSSWLDALAPDRAPSASLLDALGGRRGIVDGGAPSLVFVAVNAVAAAYLSRPEALSSAIAAAVSLALGIVGIRMFRKEPLRQVLGGLIGLVIAVAFALRSGEARGFFLPGIYVDAAYALIFAASVLVRRPLVGTLWSLISKSRDWQADLRLRRRFAIATLGWSLVYAVRAAVQTTFYVDDSPGFLAAAKLLLGWPLTAVAVVLTLAYLRRLTTTSSHTTAPLT